jgi:hypothetical protein
MAADTGKPLPPFTRVRHATDRMNVPAGDRNYMTACLLRTVAARADIVYRSSKEKGVLA